MYAPPYSTPPPGYHYDSYRGATPMSPSSNYYSTRHGLPTPSPRDSPSSKAYHSRRASHAVPQSRPVFSSTHGGAPSFMPDFQSPRYQPTPQRTPEYVSGDFGYVRTGRPRRDTDATPLKRSHRERKRPAQSARYVHTKVVYDDYDPYVYDYGFDHVYDYPPPPYEPYAHYETRRNADPCCYDQVPIYEQDSKPASRPRRASHATRPQHQPMPTPKRPTTASKTATKATEEDARRAGIPAGFSYKNWDPAEEPIMLLGSVFDANSLGKWIYDWTVFQNGAATPLAEMAGELWLLLIQLAGKVKRADELMPKIRKQSSREMVEDFLESGERLWIRFAKLLKVCEDYMWKAAKKETGEKKPVSMGKNSGCEFVNSIFGRDRELEKTEKLMTGMRLWSMRFDANCEEILRHPSA